MLFIFIEIFILRLLHFAKFFNLNEIPETEYNTIIKRIKEVGKYTIYNKETIQEIIDKINAETIVKNGKKHQFSTSDYGIGIYTAGGEHIGLVIGRESAGYNGRKYYFQDEGKLQDEIRDMLKYCGKDLPIIKADEDVEFSVANG